MSGEKDRGSGNANYDRWAAINGFDGPNPICSNCNEKPATDEFGDEFCTQDCLDEWTAYQDDCAAHEQEAS